MYRLSTQEHTGLWHVMYRLYTSEIRLESCHFTTKSRKIPAEDVLTYSATDIMEVFAPTGFRRQWFVTVGNVDDCWCNCTSEGVDNRGRWASLLLKVAFDPWLTRRANFAPGYSDSSHFTRARFGRWTGPSCFSKADASNLSGAPHMREPCENLAESSIMNLSVLTVSQLPGFLYRDQL